MFKKNFPGQDTFWRAQKILGGYLPQMSPRVVGRGCECGMLRRVHAPWDTNFVKVLKLTIRFCHSLSLFIFGHGTPQATSRLISFCMNVVVGANGGVKPIGSLKEQVVDSTVLATSLSELLLNPKTSLSMPQCALGTLPPSSEQECSFPHRQNLISRVWNGYQNILTVVQPFFHFAPTRQKHRTCLQHTGLSAVTSSGNQTRQWSRQIFFEHQVILVRNRIRDPRNASQPFQDKRQRYWAQRWNRTNGQQDPRCDLHLITKQTVT